MNGSAVASNMRKHVAKKLPHITRLAENNRKQGVLLEARVYKQRFGEAKMFGSAKIIGTGNTPLQTLTDYERRTRPRVEASPGEGWEYDMSATIFYWYKVGKDGRLQRTHIATTRSLKRSVERLLHKERKETKSQTRAREKETEKEMERQLLLRDKRVKETLEEVEYWLKITGYRSIGEWSIRQLQDSLRNEAEMRHSIRSGNRLSSQKFDGQIWSLPGSKGEQDLNIPLDLDAFRAAPNEDSPVNHEPNVPVHLN